MIVSILLIMTIKLERTYFKYRVQRTSAAAIFFEITILSVQLLRQMNVMLNFICIGPVELPGTRRNSKRD